MQRFHPGRLRAVLDCLAPWSAADGIHEPAAILRDSTAFNAWRTHATSIDPEHPSPLADEFAGAAAADHLGALQDELIALDQLLAGLHPEERVGTVVEEGLAEAITVSDARATIRTAIDAMMPALDVLYAVRKSMFQHRGRMQGPTS